MFWCRTTLSRHVIFTLDATVDNKQDVRSVDTHFDNGDHDPVADSIDARRNTPDDPSIPNMQGCRSNACLGLTVLYFLWVSTIHIQRYLRWTYFEHTRSGSVLSRDHSHGLERCSINARPEGRFDYPARTSFLQPLSPRNDKDNWVRFSCGPYISRRNMSSVRSMTCVSNWLSDSLKLTIPCVSDSCRQSSYCLVITPYVWCFAASEPIKSNHAPDGLTCPLSETLPMRFMIVMRTISSNYDNHHWWARPSFEYCQQMQGDRNIEE